MSKFKYQVRFLNQHNQFTPISDIQSQIYSSNDLNQAKETLNQAKFFQGVKGVIVDQEANTVVFNPHFDPFHLLTKNLNSHLAQS